MSPRICEYHPSQAGALTDRSKSDIPLVLTAFILWKLIKGTKLRNLAEIPLEEALERAARDPGYGKELPRWQKIVGFLWD